MSFITQGNTAVGPIGQGTWYLGEDPARFAQECGALRAGIEAGMTLIDTAEMYGEGAAERLVGAAVRGIDRKRLYLVSKVYPFHAGRKDIFRCCENSLRRMGTDYIDLYLLHWRGSIPLAESVDCLEELKARKRILAWGVSNFDTGDMNELFSTPGGSKCAANQVLYHLGSRGVEFDLLPQLRKRDIPLMAYCPLAQAGRLRRGMLNSPVVLEVACAHQATPQQVLLAFLLAQAGVLPIPRTSDPIHALENAAAGTLHLTKDELSHLDQAFPAPKRKVPLDMQ